jgi:hypothetical protein
MAMRKFLPTLIIHPSDCQNTIVALLPPAIPPPRASRKRMDSPAQVV